MSFLKKSVDTIVRRRNNSFLTLFKKVGIRKDVPEVPQAPNYPNTWSKSQRPRSEAYVGPKFEQKNFDLQPNPPAAIQLISEKPISKVHTRIVSCDGGNGDLGHPKIYINLDKGKPAACGYCGNRFQMDGDHHHHH